MKIEHKFVSNLVTLANVSLGISIVSLFFGGMLLDFIALGIAIYAMAKLSRCVSDIADSNNSAMRFSDRDIQNNPDDAETRQRNNNALVNQITETRNAIRRALIASIVALALNAVSSFYLLPMLLETYPDLLSSYGINFSGMTSTTTNTVPSTSSIWG